MENLKLIDNFTPERFAEWIRPHAEEMNAGGGDDSFLDKNMPGLPALNEVMAIGMATHVLSLLRGSSPSVVAVATGILIGIEYAQSQVVDATLEKLITE